MSVADGKMARMTKDEFQLEIINAAKKYSLRYIADCCAVSPVSVIKWMRGLSAPHPALRSRVFELLEDNG